MQPFPPEDEAAIMAECRKHQAEHGSKTGCVLIEPYPYFVRYGDPETLASYIETRSFLWNSEQQTKKPRIPKLIHQFPSRKRTRDSISRSRTHQARAIP